MKQVNYNFVYLKTFKSSYKTLVAACDKDILGRTFKSGRFKLEVKESFYKGTLTSISDALQILNAADIANLTGKNIVQAAVHNGCADSRAIIRIGGIPHLQIMKL
ncbi:DUF424 domain-containing protein [[Eubacterium] cellulosolvens]